MKSIIFFLLGVASFTSVSAKKSICNICGCENCTFADPLGVVNFVYDNKPEKRPCQQLQQEVENPTIYNTTYCHSVIWKAAFEPCICYNENAPDVLLTDIEGTSINPRHEKSCHRIEPHWNWPFVRLCHICAPTGYGEREYGNSGLVEDDSQNCEGDDCDDENRGGNGSGNNGNGGSNSGGDGDEPGQDGPGALNNGSGAVRVQFLGVVIVGALAFVSAL